MPLLRTGRKSKAFILIDTGCPEGSPYPARENYKNYRITRSSFILIINESMGPVYIPGCSLSMSADKSR